MIRLLTSNEQLFRQQRSRSRSRESLSVFMPGFIYVNPEVNNNNNIELQSVAVVVDNKDQTELKKMKKL